MNSMERSAASSSRMMLRSSGQPPCNHCTMALERPLKCSMMSFTDVWGCHARMWWKCLLMRIIANHVKNMCPFIDIAIIIL